MSLWLILAAIVLVVAALLLRRAAHRRKRKELLATALSAGQREIMANLVPITRRLPQTLRPALEGKINLFLDQVTFHAYGELELNDEMKLSIAAQACLLVVNSPVWFDTLRTVLIYPSTIFTGRHTHDDGIVHEGASTIAGESWSRGPVVLSWDHALKGGLDPDDGSNVVIHEFAHQLDNLTGHTNGVPILRKGQRYERWEKAMLEAYEGHVERVQAGRASLIDPYGATNHQEFFAEAVVTFFEKPEAMRHEETALYEQLAKLFALDPAEWG
ncbi:zinc-dependent peptidase [Aurantiacibacter aquimixticola]|uniref:Zinc-dependent peptidase n=1 Tax=Aurantiacibacter aquimixticola TaxID=1958945 RepID=A0A419RSS4_9SPHN|nr:M90 family metallopeptidase [Aurantiacibacter aquimixticola]RJY08841.1 zinc-dependent peptidase [Aurantiacibacter aquimixticola]